MVPRRAKRWCVNGRTEPERFITVERAWRLRKYRNRFEEHLQPRRQSQGRLW